MAMWRVYLVFLTLLVTSCSPPPPCDYDLFGEEEFVADSQIIYEEGKFGILALEGQVFADLPPDALEPYADKIAEDDVLNVVLFHPSRRDLMDVIHSVCTRTGGFKVAQGYLYLPDFPPMYVAGLTLSEAKEKLTSYLRTSMPDADIFVTFKERPSHKVELLGSVQRDSIEVDGRVCLYEILAKAHLPQDANLYASYLLRDNRPLKVDMNRLIREGDMSQNLVMRAGDKIYIANGLEKTALVMGEVRAPRPIPLVSGSLSLREALALAGGIPYTGDERHIQVIRGDICCPKIFVLSMKRVVHENNHHLLLIPGDVVYVSQKPITKWNIFLSELAPTLNIVLTSQAIYNLTR